MLRVIVHRGPDDEGLYVNGAVGMGMRRLSIIDLAGGKQPISNEDGSVVVVFNGEIYNYVELRDTLRRKGHTLATATDTEVIVHLYEDYGEDCVQHLRGMFAFALWDANRRRLFIARDRLGIKPLYYAEHRGRLIFGSEIKSLLEHPGADAQLDPEALSHYLSLKYVPAPETMFAGIRALPPGHALTCDRKGLDIRRYWRLSFARASQPRNEDESTEELESLLLTAVKLHLRSDVPFGAFLSGGLDSSTIVALMSELLRTPVKTFSVGFAGRGESVSELPYARVIADRYNTDHHEILVEPSDIVRLAEKVVWHLDQPIADPACIANYMVAELAARHVKMVLTGEGGDELFAGYARYSGERLSRIFRLLPPSGKAALLKAAERVPGLRRPKLALFALCQPSEASRLTNWFPLLNSEMKEHLLSSEYRRYAARLRSAEEVFGKHLDDTDAADPLSRMLYVDTQLWLPDDLLARGDKTSMAVSLEARVPLLDHPLVEFAASLPPNLKLRALTRKYLLKKVARKWLPPRIIDRKKQGFPMPFATWFRREARTFVRDLLAPDLIRRRGIFNPAAVEKLLHQHESGVADHANLLWGLMALELWQRAFLDAPGWRRGARSLSAVQS
jgi:asparagine synthase (glutamine-hydrolysing)